jgi:protein-tyrosine phosphatase
MAEAIFKDMVKKKGLEGKIHVDSAGTGGWHKGNPPHKGTQSILTKNNIDFTGQTARQVIQEDIAKFHYIIGMDVENVGNLRRMAGHTKTAYIARLLDFVPHLHIEDVPDPYFTGNFDEVYDLVQEGCKALLDEIIEKYFL